MTMGEIMIRTVAVIGGGAAGMMAAVQAARAGATHTHTHTHTARVGQGRKGESEEEN